MKKLSPKQKASIALAALRGEKISKLSLACGKHVASRSDYQVHPNQISKWKKLAEEELEVLFTDKRKLACGMQERKSFAEKDY